MQNVSRELREPHSHVKRAGRRAPYKPPPNLATCWGADNLTGDGPDFVGRIERSDGQRFDVRMYKRMHHRKGRYWGITFTPSGEPALAAPSMLDHLESRRNCVSVYAGKHRDKNGADYVGMMRFLDGLAVWVKVRLKESVKGDPYFSVYLAPNPGTAGQTPPLTQGQPRECGQAFKPSPAITTNELGEPSDLPF